MKWLKGLQWGETEESGIGRGMSPIRESWVQKFFCLGNLNAIKTGFECQSARRLWTD